MLSKRPPMLPTQGKLPAAFGERLRLARLRRQLSVETACARAGISRMTLYRAEEGSPAAALGTYLRILSVLKLEADLDQLARDDELGRLPQDAELPAHRRRASVAKGVPGSRGLSEPRRDRSKA